MYYVIKRQYIAPTNRFVGFIVSKYIASKANENVIFEFLKDGKSQRKWVKKDDIVLLTEDKNFFIEILNRFRAVESTQQELVNEAKAQLDLSIETFTEVMDKELEEYIATQHSQDINLLFND